ncbi:hypothetical protein FHT44_005007 [Mycolicibacterium sp. BK634]|nr:hypothetical protein [Mycolicibacterium sp. BK634]
MIIAEVCNGCGAERPSWHGGSHVKRCYTHHVEHAACCDGKTAEEDWRTRKYSFMSIPRHWATA